MFKSMLSRVLLLAAGACLLLALTACGGQTQPSGGSPADPPDAAGGETAPEAEVPALDELLGQDYQAYLVETITMQMDNRMQDQGDVEFYPIRDQAPLTDYAPMDETTEFEVNEDGNVVILFPAGTVADESHGDQSFIVPVP
jgi:hypothetical protein